MKNWRKNKDWELEKFMWNIFKHLRFTGLNK